MSWLTSVSTICCLADGQQLADSPTATREVSFCAGFRTPAMTRRCTRARPASEKRQGTKSREVGHRRCRYRKRRPAQVAACFAEIFSLYEQGKAKPAAAIVFPLARAGEALAALRDRRVAGRTVLNLRDD